MRSRLLLLILFAAYFLVTGCSSNVADDTNPTTQDKYLVSYTYVRSMTMTEVNGLFSPVQSIYPDVAQILPSIKYGLKVYSITYNTTLGTKKLIASGLVCIPDGGGTYPILSFQNGTNTLYANAPSLNAGSYTGQMISGFAAAGFVVVMPDYLGFGASTSVFHPYLDMTSTVNSILDMFRAVKEMNSKAELSLKTSSDLYLMGYSQGGLSTLQLHKAIETSYSNEFNLKAVGCGAGPYYLNQLTEMILGIANYPQPYYLAYIMKGFKSINAYANPYTDIFNEPYASRIDGLFNGTNSGSVINNSLTTNVSQLLTSEFRTTFSTNTKYKELRDALTASSVPAWKIKTPLVLTHGQADTDVSPIMSSQLYADLMKLDGSLPVTYIPMPGFDHGSASAPSLVSFVKKFLTIKGN